MMVVQEELHFRPTSNFWSYQSASALRVSPLFLIACCPSHRAAEELLAEVCDPSVEVQVCDRRYFEAIGLV